MISKSYDGMTSVTLLAKIELSCEVRLKGNDGTKDYLKYVKITFLNDFSRCF